MIGRLTVMSQSMSQNENATPKSSAFVFAFGRGEWIRTTDLTVTNDRRGKNVSICLSKVAATREFRAFYIRSHSLPFAIG